MKCVFAIIDVLFLIFIFAVCGSMFSKLMTTGSKFVMEGVRNLVIGERVWSLAVVCTEDIDFFKYFCSIYLLHALLMH